MKLVVFGANGPTGRRTTELAAARGHEVTAVTRRPAEFPVRHSRVRVVAGDVYDQDAVDNAVEGQDAVISTLGAPYQKETVTLYSQSAANIIRAARKHALRRLVAVTSLATMTTTPPGETWFYRRVIGPVLLRMGRTVYEDMTRMERIIQDSGLDWTVIRPAGLFDGDVVTGYQLEDRYPAGRFTSRTDLADALVRTATEDLHIGQLVNMVTTEGVPTYPRMFLREALRIGR